MSRSRGWDVIADLRKARMEDGLEDLRDCYTRSIVEVLTRTSHPLDWVRHELPTNSAVEGFEDLE